MLVSDLMWLCDFLVLVCLSLTLGRVAVFSRDVAIEVVETS